MDFGSILLSLALFLLVAAFVARPLLDRASAEDTSTTATDDLVTQREAILIELRDLDFDHETSKVGDDEYAAQRARLVAKGVEILRALSAANRAEQAAPASGNFDDEIEKAVAARRKRKAVPASASSKVDDEIEKAVAARRKSKSAPAKLLDSTAETRLESNIQATSKVAPAAPSGASAFAKFCPQCGAAAVPGDKFCARCGASLALASETA